MLRPTASGAAPDEPRARGDKPADAGDFGDLLSAIAEETGQRPGSARNKGDGSALPERAAGEQTSDSAHETEGLRRTVAANGEHRTWQDRLAALLHPASGETQETAPGSLAPDSDVAAGADGNAAKEAADGPATEILPHRNIRPAGREHPTAPVPLDTALPPEPVERVADDTLLTADETYPEPEETPAPADPHSTTGAEMLAATSRALPSAAPPAQTQTAGTLDERASMAGETPAAPDNAPEAPIATLPLRILLRETHFAPVTPFDVSQPSTGLTGLPPAPASAAAGKDTGSFRLPDPAAHPASEDNALPADPSAGRETRLNDVVVPMARRDEARAAGRDSSLPASGPQLDTTPAAMAGQVAASVPSAPLAPTGTPADQVGAAIQRAGALPLGGAPAFEASARGPVRILEIQLHPVELGVVTVRLRNGRNGLEVRVQAARAETAQLLAQDRTALLASLTEQGHVAADLTITSLTASAGLTGHDARGLPSSTWPAPDEGDSDGRQQHSGARRDGRQNDTPAQRDTDDGASE
ncbi:flagellar hook-length control protein FliK [Ancylobacter radicis]|uniref:Flagellar hook-length control protein FliK n=1 Tax=Ancylobacter radicis TaxID=2836179 RepID=A0ABS5RCE1_9HYPH|nr:flagellar hook-length control protein FliK [Ancylobacter radicis]MBS9479328.1 flagellar hook-length control protein FliK [Ancylobacter radicis]